MSVDLMQQRLRRAVTLIEVVFSIGVILIGLLGLLSILPLAGRRAQDSISLSVGPAIGLQVIDELQSRHYLSEGRLRPVRETTSTAVTNLTATPAPTSFCIDPIFASSTTVPSSAVSNGYSAAQFPYYKATHSPLIDPSTNSTTWPSSQPRMTRVGIAEATSPTIFVAVSEALEIAENRDDLFVTRPDDKTLNPTFADGQVQAVSSGLEYGKRIPTGDFTWFATVNPLPGGQYASISVVVVKKRIRNFDTPTTTTAPGTPQGNAIGERLAYVTFASGFSGGAGGTVHLISNANTVSKIRSDDWIMLSRNVGTAVVHRWYRVVAVNGKAELYTTDGTTTNDDTNLGARIPGGSHQVWRHKVLLDGPDWSFNFQSVGPAPRSWLRRGITRTIPS